MQTYQLWTDGSCGALSQGVHPITGDLDGRFAGDGGWCAILVAPGGGKLAVYGWATQTTNNRMELLAVIEGLKALGESRCRVTVHTDSSYVKNAFTQGWLKKWKSNGWRNSKGGRVDNQDLWFELMDLVARHTVQWVHVRGHQRKPTLNHDADWWAVKARQWQTEGREFL